jgi:ribosomal protein S17E
LWSKELIRRNLLYSVIKVINVMTNKYEHNNDIRRALADARSKLLATYTGDVTKDLETLKQIRSLSGIVSSALTQDIETPPQLWKD